MALLVFFLYVVRTVRNLFYHLAWWEIKEYRFDRMIVHLTDTYQGHTWIFGIFPLMKWMLILLFLFLPSTISQITLVNFTLLLYAAEGIGDIAELKQDWKMPPARVRIAGIWLVSLIVLSWLFFLPVLLPLKLLLIDKAIGITVALCIALSNIVFSFHKKRVLSHARRKMAQYDIDVVGITGSYGKTSTKEFVAQILGSKYNVVKTLASQNSDIGIAERILTSDLSKCDIFVCEMAAYHPGEIASSCSLFGNKINVGIMTAINEQHQSLFGSIETTMKSKYELIEAVRNGGTALFNGENTRCREMSKWPTHKKVHSVIINKTHINHLPQHIHGAHFKENLSLAAAACESMGMTKREIVKAMDTIELPPRTMDTAENGKVTLINDTFNANPDAVYAALSHIKKMDGKKVLVLQPLIELGKYAGEVHRKIGALSAEICDQVILTNKNFNKPFFEGASSIAGGRAKVSVAGKLHAIREGVILCEGKEAEKYLKEY